MGGAHGLSVAVLSGHIGWVERARFSPDGRYVLTAGMDKTAHIYACDTCASAAQLLALARTRVTRSLAPQERQQYVHE